MGHFPDSPQFEPYQLYRANVTAIEDFAEQSRFCYRIAQQFVSGTPGSTPSAMHSQANTSALPAQEENTFTQTNQMLLAHCFVMEWLLFETFLKNTLFALFEKHPEKITDHTPEQHVSVREIHHASRTFTSIAHLRNWLITREIEREQGFDHSALHLIDVLARTFHFQHSPYDEEYLYKGQRSTVNTRDLAGIRATYFSILPDISAMRRSAGEEPQSVEQPFQPIAMSEDVYLKSKAILHAVAASIAQSIDNNWYDPA